MAANKTQPTEASVLEFLEQVEPEKKRDDALEILRLMQDVSGYVPTLWGSSIVGFGRYHYRYESGREGDFLRIGFSPRKRNFALYIMDGISNYDDLLSKLGKYKNGKSCLYINRLADVDKEILRELMVRSLEAMKERYPEEA